jgi:hypothetical protein
MTACEPRKKLSHVRTLGCRYHGAVGANCIKDIQRLVTGG